jgi:hypothetical protein
MKRRDLFKVLGGALVLPLCGKTSADSNEPEKQEPKEGIHIESSSYHNVHPHHNFDVLDEYGQAAQVTPWAVQIDKYGFECQPRYGRTSFDCLDRPYTKYDITEMIDPDGFIHKVMGRRQYEDVRFSRTGAMDESTKFLQSLIYEEKPVRRTLIFSRESNYKAMRKVWAFSGWLIGVTCSDFDFSLDVPIATIEYTFKVDGFVDWS